MNSCVMNWVDGAESFLLMAKKLHELRIPFLYALDPSLITGKYNFKVNSQLGDSYGLSLIQVLI